MNYFFGKHTLKNKEYDVTTKEFGIYLIKNLYDNSLSLIERSEEELLNLSYSN
jgi:hypothetical protein